MDATKSVSEKPRVRPRLRLLAPALAAIFIINCLYWAQQPFQPRYPMNGLDPSWVAVLGEGAARGWQWGEQVAFTYGPAISLHTNYYTELYAPLNLLVGLLIAVTIGSCAAILVWRSKRRGLANALAVLTLGVAVTFTVMARDAFMFTCALIVFFLGFRSIEIGRGATAAATVGAAVSGILALVKMTFIICALPMFLAADAHRLLQRRWPVLTPAFLVAAAVTYLALGQSLAWLPRFIVLQGETARGHSEAMALRGNYRELALFLVLSLLLGAAVLCTEATGAASRTSRLSSALLIAGFSASWLLAFKAGFVRQDMHTLIAWQTAGMGAILYALWRDWPEGTASRGALSCMLVTGFAMAALIAPWRGAVEEPNDHLARLGRTYREVLLGNPARHWSGLLAYVSDPSAWQARAAAEKERAWASIRQARPLPKLAGRVDIIPSEQAAVLANGLDYAPRPVFQEYLTYTPRLVEANRTYFQGKDAPDWVIFSPGSIDNRYPSSAEGALWPNLLALYEPASLGRDLLFLRRRAQPLQEVPGSVRRVRARLGQTITVGGDAPVFAKVVMHETVLGHVLKFLFRAPEVLMVVTTRGGRALAYRLIPEMAASGFVLSPHVAATMSYLALALGAADAIDDEQVETVRIVLGSLDRLQYANSFEVEFSTMNTEALARAGSGNPLRKEIEARSLLAKIMLNPASTRSEMIRLINEGLFAHPPARLALEVPPGAKRLTLGFGILDGAWQTGRTDGVCFRVGKANEAGAAPALFERCLQPLTQINDRGEHTAKVDLAGLGAAHLWLETTCGTSCNWDWAYWSNVQFE